MSDPPNLTSEQHRNLPAPLVSPFLLIIDLVVANFIAFFGVYFLIVVVVAVVMSSSSISLPKQKSSISSSLDFETQLTIIVDDFDSQLIIARDFVAISLQQISSLF